MKLIYDSVVHDKNSMVLLEGVVKQDGKDKPKTIMMKGPNIITDVKGINGRIYPSDVMDEAVKIFKENWVDKNRALGELEHPEGRTRIEPCEACDRLVSLEKDPENPNIWIGESIVLASDPIHGIHGTPKGDILASILCHGGQVGRSTRGVGDFDESSGIVSTFSLVCIDSVLEPSFGSVTNQECIVEGVLQNKEFMINEHGDIVEVKYNALEKKLSVLPVADRQQFINECIKTFIASI